MSDRIDPAVLDRWEKDALFWESRYVHTGKVLSRSEVVATIHRTVALCAEVKRLRVECPNGRPAAELARLRAVEAKALGLAERAERNRAWKPGVMLAEEDRAETIVRDAAAMKEGKP